MDFLTTNNDYLVAYGAITSLAVLAALALTHLLLEANDDEPFKLLLSAHSSTCSAR